MILAIALRLCYKTPVFTFDIQVIVNNVRITVNGSSPAFPVKYHSVVTLSITLLLLQRTVMNDMIRRPV